LRATLEIEKLKFQIAKLRRMQFGRSSERVTRQIEQLELRLEELEAGEAEAISQAAGEGQPLPIRQRSQPKRKKLPDLRSWTASLAACSSAVASANSLWQATAKARNASGSEGRSAALL
jgi:hypothetical protein